MSQRQAKRDRRSSRPPHRSPPMRSGRMRVALVAVVLLLGLGGIAAAVALSRNNSPASPAAVQSTGSGLSLHGTDPVTGAAVSLATYTGKPIVLNMWASWCTGCIAEARALGSFERAHPEAQVIGLDVQDTKSGAAAFYTRFGWRHPSIYDPNGVIAARLGLQGLPTTLFLDRQHRIVGRILGDTNLAGFTQGLRQAIHA